MDFEFVKEKWKNQKEYNSSKSATYKLLYYCFEVPSLILGIITPVIIPFTNNKYTLIPIITSATAALLKAISTFFGFHKKWVVCRNLTEAYKIEQLNYMAGIKGYANLPEEKRKEKFASAISDLISLGNSQWLESEEKKIEEESLEKGSKNES